MTKVSDERRTDRELSDMIQSLLNHGEAGYTYVKIDAHLSALRELQSLRAAPSNPVVSDEMVERMAEWMALDHVSVSDRAEYSWDATDAVWKDAWRKKAQTALEAALSVKPQSEGGKP